MIVLATDDFEVYHDVVAELRERDAAFTTVERGDPLPDAATVVVTSVAEVDVVRDAVREEFDDRVRSATGVDEEAADDRTSADPDDRATGDVPIEVVGATPDGARAAVEDALQIARGGAGRRVVGVDPGDRPGIAVLVGETVVAAYHVPVADAPAVIRSEVADAEDPVVRIGDGARLRGSRLIDALDDVRVELVDETGTTPSLGTGASGLGDVLAAVNIARREGEVVEGREIDPTAGEVRSIQERSREVASDNRAIDERLARRVARGELTLEEALATHRDRS